MRQQIVVQALIQDYLKTHPVKDEDMLAEYNKLKGARGDKEYKARHILVDKDSEANGHHRAAEERCEVRGPRQAVQGPGSRKSGDLELRTFLPAAR